MLSLYVDCEVCTCLPVAEIVANTVCVERLVEFETASRDEGLVTSSKRLTDCPPVISAALAVTNRGNTFIVASWKESRLNQFWRSVSDLLD